MIAAIAVAVAALRAGGAPPTPHVAGSRPASSLATAAAPVAVVDTAPATPSEASVTPTAPPSPARITPPPAPAAAPVKDAAPSGTGPEQMSRLLPGTRQVIVITGSRLGANTGTLAVYDLEGAHWTQVLSTPANFGKNGLGDGAKRTEGNLQTPTGIWWIGGFVFGQHATAPAGTKMPYRRITANSWWSGQHDATYNKWVETSRHIGGEHLADARVQYEYAFDTGYNALPNQRVIGRGAAIFIHCFEPPGESLGQFTHGCVAISRTQMLKLFSLLDPARHPCCAIGTLEKGATTSIFAY